MRRMVCLFLMLILLLGLCACGQQAPAWQEQYDLGVRYLEEGSYEEAIIAFTAAIEIDPKQAPAYVGRGDAYISSGETEENLAAAQADYEAAIALDETIPEAWLGLADVYIRRGNYEKALEVLQEGLSATGNDELIENKIIEIESGNIVDSSGNIRRETTYDGSGQILYYLEYTYFPNGRTATAASYDGSGTQTGYAECSYDEEGNSIDSYYFHSQDLMTVNPLRRTLDAQGREIRSDWFWNDGTLHQYTESKYDQAGNRIEWLVYEPNGALIQQDVTEYSTENIRVVETSYHYYNDGTLMNYSIDLYNEYGAPIKSTSYAAEGEITSYLEYTYYEPWQKATISFYGKDGVLQNRTEFIYDDTGTLVSETIYGEDGTVQKTTVY